MKATHRKEARHHVMGQNDGLQFALWSALVTVLPRQDVDLPLVHAQLADVSLRSGV